MSEVVIRPLRPDDADAFIALFESIAAEGRWIGAEAPLPEKRKRRIRADALDSPAGEAMFVAEADGGELVGWAWSGLDGGGRADLAMGVAEAWRGEGLGRRLAEATIDWARAEGVHKINLEVWPHNGPARRLYEKLGFAVEGRRRRHWRRANGELWDAVVMGLVLDETSPGSPWPDA
jgi:RimJ/RimL family protein N-acetyltransferase